MASLLPLILQQREWNRGPDWIPANKSWAEYLAPAQQFSSYPQPQNHNLPAMRALAAPISQDLRLASHLHTGLKDDRIYTVITLLCLQADPLPLLPGRLLTLHAHEAPGSLPFPSLPAFSFLKWLQSSETAATGVCCSTHPFFLSFFFELNDASFLLSGS